VFLSWERSQETHFKGLFSLDLCCGNFLSFWKCSSCSGFSFWVNLFGAGGSDALRMQSVLYI
jgi:hypothetical protein